MGVAATLDRRSARLARLLGATALSCLFASAVIPESAFAQTVADLAPDIPEGSEMLLEADTLIYDNNDDTVTASRSSIGREPVSIPTRSTSRTTSATASSTRCASRPSTRPISRPKAVNGAAAF